MTSIQKFFTSRDNNANSATFVGELDRLWYDPVTNTIYVSDGSTPGGIAVGGGGGNGTPAAPNHSIQFNNNGLFGGSAALTYDAANAVLTIAGNVVANAVLTDNYLYANGQPFTPGTNYSNANVANYLSSGNVTTDIITSGNVTANTNVTGNLVVAENGLFLNANTVTQSYTIPPGYNAISGGPVDVPGGVVVDTTNGRWTIV